jgi:glycosyltransferase involved in cell wall biosynthesis
MGPVISELTRLPGVTVVVRSYKRHASLLRILEVLQHQDHPDYEVVVMEQSCFDARQRAPLDALARRDPRFRIVYSEPLGVGGARDAGWRLARKEIVLAIDDDDLPVGCDFVGKHARNYLDRDIVAVTGRHVYTLTERCGYRRRKTALKRCLNYNFFGYPHAYCRLDQRVEHVKWVHGSNGSVRRDVIERVGGWDKRSVDHDEHPFCLPLQKQLRPGERLVFDPSVVLLRRKDIPGGANVRFEGSKRVYRMWFRYYHGLIRQNLTVRFYALYPIFPVASAFSATRWIWTDSMMHQGLLHKLTDSLRTVALSPLWYAQELRRLTRTSA